LLARRCGRCTGGRADSPFVAGRARHDLDDVVASGLVGQGFERAIGAEHQLRARAALLGIDALHRRREIGDVERTLQGRRQAGVADIDDDARSLRAQVRRRAVTAETHDQLARAAIATLEVDAGDRHGGRRLLGRIDSLAGGCLRHGDHRHRGAGRCSLHGTEGRDQSCHEPDGTGPPGLGTPGRPLALRFGRVGDGHLASPNH
jgi:hypothetical protein